MVKEPPSLLGNHFSTSWEQFPNCCTSATSKWCWLTSKALQPDSRRCLRSAAGGMAKALCCSLTKNASHTARALLWIWHLNGTETVANKPTAKTRHLRRENPYFCLLVKDLSCTKHKGQAQSWCCLPQSWVPTEEILLCVCEEFWEQTPL